MYRVVSGCACVVTLLLLQQHSTCKTMEVLKKISINMQVLCDGNVFVSSGCVVVFVPNGCSLVLSLFHFFRPTPLVREGLKKLLLGLSQHCQRHDAAPYITPNLLTWLRAHKQKHRQSKTKNQKHNILKDNSAIYDLFTAPYKTKAQKHHKKQTMNPIAFGMLVYFIF